MRTSAIALVCSVAAVPAIAQTPHSAATVTWGPGPHGEGPFAITYVRSADDPRNAKP
jgi:hypothetical protein